MDRLRSGLLASVIAVSLGTALFAGCTADGGAIGEYTPEPAKTSDPTTPLNPGGGDDTDPEQETDGGGTTPKKDAGANKDSGVVTPPPTIVPNTPCTKLNEVFEEQCGACGKHSAICLADNPDAGAASTGKWSGWSSCDGQVAGGCEPGTEVEESCGNCGKRKLKCSKYCAFDNPVCAGQPTDSCPPGSVAFVSAGCGTATYRQKTCKADCTYNPVSQTCNAPPVTFSIAPTVGGVSSTIAILESSKVMKKLSGTCGANSTTVSTIETPYTYIQVTNSLPKAATVSIYNSQVLPGGPIIDTILAAYQGNVSPTADAARKACDQGIGNFGTAALVVDTKFASLDGTKKVTIPAGGTVSIYVAANAAFSSATPNDTTGPVMLNAKTEAIAP